MITKGNNFHRCTECNEPMILQRWRDVHIDTNYVLSNVWFTEYVCRNNHKRFVDIEFQYDNISNDEPYGHLPHNLYPLVASTQNDDVQVKQLNVQLKGIHDRYYKDHA